MTVLANGVPYSNYFAHRNLLINGDFRVRQRESGVQSSTLNGFKTVADRWFLWTSGAALTYATPDNAQNAGTKSALQLIGASGNTEAVLSQRVESINCYFDIGAKCTFGCWVYSTVPKTIRILVQSMKAIDTIASGVTTISTKDMVIPANVWTPMFMTIDATLECRNGMVAVVAVMGGIGGSETVYVTNAQLEAGPVATPFEHRPYGYELSLCQRYFVNVASSSWYGITAESSAVAYRMLSFPTRMRVPPSLSMRGQAVIRGPGGGTTVNTTSAVINGVNVDHVMVMYNFPNTPAIVSGQAIIAQEGELLFDAEIY